MKGVRALYAALLEAWWPIKFGGLPDASSNPNNNSMTILSCSASNVKRFIEIFKTILSPSFLQHSLPKALKDKRLHKHGSFKKSVSIPQNMLPLLIHIAPEIFGHLPNVGPIEEAIRSLIALWAGKLPQGPPSFTEVVIDIPRLFEPDLDKNDKMLKTGKTYSLFPAFVKPYSYHLNVSRDAAFLSRICLSIPM